MNFTPDNKSEAQEVPFFEDVMSSDGWEGHRSDKTIDRLKKEVADAVDRLGGVVRDYRSGIFTIGEVERPGFQFFYTLGGAPSRIDIAALPVRNKSNREKSLKMALFMLRNGLRGLWYFQQLSPGFAPLMPFMLADREGNTVSQLWAKESSMKILLPPGDSDFETVPGEVIG